VVDPAGQAIVVGYTGSTDFPTTPGAFQTTFQPHRPGIAPPRTGFLTKLASTGATLVYSTYLGPGGPNSLGGASENFASALALDPAGAAYVTGRTCSADFPTTPDAFSTYSELCDAFVTKLDAAGALVYSTTLGGPSTDGGNAIAVDGLGRAVVIGSTSSSHFPTTEGGTNFETDRTMGGPSDAFLAVLNPTGTGLVFGTYLGGNAGDGAGTLSPVGTGGDLFVVGGTTASTDEFLPGPLGGLDGFVHLRRIPGPGQAGCQGGFTIGPTTHSGEPSTIRRHILTQVCSGTAASGILVDLEIHNVAGEKVVQRVFDTQSFGDRESKAYNLRLTEPPLPDGTYTVKIGVFSNDWSILHAWDNNAATFQVGDSPPPPGPCTAGVTIGPTSAAPSSVARGETITIQARVCSSGALLNALVDLGIYYGNPGGGKLAQQTFSGQSFAAGEARDYRWDFVVPVSAPAFVDAVYHVKVGVFTADWSSFYQWDDLAATFQIAGGPPLPTHCGPGFVIGPTTVTPSPVPRGATATIQADVCSPLLQADILVDLEIYDAGGQKVAHQIFPNQNFSASETRSYAWPYLAEGTLAPGTYTVKIGVFSGNWSVLHRWENQAATFVVQ
jgi:hypothetical protein